MSERNLAQKIIDLLNAHADEHGRGVDIEEALSALMAVQARLIAGVPRAKDRKSLMNETDRELRRGVTTILQGWASGSGHA